MTKTLDDICKIRDLLVAKDYKKMISGLAIFRRTYSSVNRNIERFIKDDRHQLDFTAQDLIDSAMDCKEVLAILNNKVNANKMIKEILKPKKITDSTVKDFTYDYADTFTLIAHLTEFHNVIAYSGSLLHVLELQYQAGELDYVVIDIIKSAFK